MSATSAATILAFPQVSPAPGLDVTSLLRLTCAFHEIGHSGIEVLVDEDGDQTRFLCRAPRTAFETREEFVAAAVKRYLECIVDRQLAEMMFVANLYEASVSQRISAAALRDRLHEAFRDGAHPPAVWVDHLSGPGVLDAVTIRAQHSDLEVVVRRRSCWVYALAEG